MRFLLPALLLGLINAVRRPGRRHHSSTTSTSSTRYDTSDTTMDSRRLDAMRRKNYLQGGHHVTLLADVGFYAFEFGKRLETVKQTFNVVLSRTAYLSVTDCFCEGDAFQVTDNGATSFLTNTNCPTGPYKCRAFESDPWRCLNDQRHCTGGAYLLPGSHNLTISVTSSVAGGGTGFLRLDTMCEDAITKQLYFCCLTGDKCVKTIFSS